MHPRHHIEAGAEAFRDRVLERLDGQVRHLEARLVKDPKDATLQQLAAQIVWLRAQVLAMPLVED